MQSQGQLSYLEAYRAMIGFLEGYYERTHSEEIAILLGGLAISQDNRPMDPAAWDDWVIVVERLKGQRGGS